MSRYALQLMHTDNAGLNVATRVLCIILCMNMLSNANHITA